MRLFLTQHQTNLLYNEVVKVHYKLPMTKEATVLENVVELTDNKQWNSKSYNVVYMCI